MADPLVVLVFLASAGQPDPVGPAMTVAAQQALGRDAVVRIDERPLMPTPDEAQSLGERAGASAVVEIAWRDSTHTLATLRVHGKDQEGWRERDIPFLAEDPPDERGRTIGFALAALVDREAQAGARPESGEQAPTRYFRSMVEAAGLGTVGVGAGTITGGGGIAGLALFLPRLAAVATANVRFGRIAAANASVSSVQLGGGALWRMLVFPTRRPFEVDLRADGLAMLLVATRRGETQSSWLPAVRAAVEGVWFPLSPSVGFLTLVGAEVAFGSASVVVGDHTVATVPPFRAVGEVGLRARF